jgi:hypothetical protein
VKIEGLSEQVAEVKKKESKDNGKKDRTINIKLHSPRNSSPKSPRDKHTKSPRSEKTEDKKERKEKNEKEETEEGKPKSPRHRKEKKESKEQTPEKGQSLSPRRNLSPETEELLNLEQKFTSRTLEKVY